MTPNYFINQANSLRVVMFFIWPIIIPIGAKYVAIDLDGDVYAYWAIPKQSEYADVHSDAKNAHIFTLPEDEELTTWLQDNWKTVYDINDLPEAIAYAKV